MESISKTPVADRAARAIVLDAFGPTARLEACSELTEGWFNAAYELTLHDGRRFVLKVAPPPDVEVLTYERDIIHAEVEAIRLVRSSTAAPVPAVVWFDDSCRHVASPLFVMTHIPGVSLWGVRGDVDPARRAELDRTLGRHLRSINDITGTSFGLLAPSATRHATWRAAFEDLFDSVLADGERRSVPLTVEYDAIRSCLALAADALDDVMEPRLVYWDLWDGNVLVDPVTHSLTGMLDLERAMWGDPLIEGQFDPTESSEALLSAYGRELLRTPNECRRRALYTLYLHVIMSIEGTYRCYPEDPIGAWAQTQLAGDIERVNGTSR